MSFQIKSSPLEKISADWLIVSVNEGGALCEIGMQVDSLLDGLLSRMIEEKDLKGKLAEVHKIYAPSQFAAKRILIVGLGKPEEITPSGLRKAYQTVARIVSERKRLRWQLFLLANGES